MEDMLRYLDEMVEPTIKDFEEHPTSVRHGFLACVAAFHAIDYLAYPKKRPSDLRQRSARLRSFALCPTRPHPLRRRHHLLNSRPRDLSASLKFDLLEVSLAHMPEGDHG
jgi:hypothetical protein